MCFLDLFLLSINASVDVIVSAPPRGQRLEAAEWEASDKSDNLWYKRMKSVEGVWRDQGSQGAVSTALFLIVTVE